MITGFSPFQGEDKDEIYKNILSRSIDDSFDKINSNNFKKFINELFDESPNERLGMKHSSFGKIRKHDFFGKAFDWKKVENCSNNNTIKKEMRPMPKQALSSAELGRYLTSIDGRLVKTLDQNLFKDFDYVNEEFFKSNQQDEITWF
jgi:hypothetical protein